MSKTQDHNYGRCTKCGKELKEERAANRTLQLTCDCTTRPIKIGEYPPESWDL